MATSATREIKRRMVEHNLVYLTDRGDVLSFDQYDGQWVLAPREEGCRMGYIRTQEATRVIETCPGKLV